MKTIQGWAHLCFFSPLTEHDGAFYEFRGHVISSTENTTLGIAGVHLPNHQDPYQNDCMDPHVFYQTTLKSYNNDNDDDDGHTSIDTLFLVRREAQDDAAGLFTEPYDNQDDKSLLFETEKFLVGTKAIEHVKKYLGHQVLKKSKTNDNSDKEHHEDDEEVEDVVVCMGKIQIKL